MLHFGIQVFKEFYIVHRKGEKSEKLLKVVGTIVNNACDGKNNIQRKFEIKKVSRDVCIM